MNYAYLPESRNALMKSILSLANKTIHLFQMTKERNISHDN